VGQGRFQTTALIELRDPLPITEQGVQALKQSLWKNMEIANIESPAHGQLHKDYMFFATKAKPFILAGKGTVLRAMTSQIYAEEIDEFYKGQESKQSSEITLIDVSSLGHIKEGISRLLRRILHNAQFGVSDDYFNIGLDSLSVFRVLTSIRASLLSAGLDDAVLKAGLIYSNPTIQKLSEAVDSLIRPALKTNGVISSVELMGTLLDKYTAKLPTRPPPSEKSSRSGSSVILTGSTGSLGSYILEDLLSKSNINRVFCLNRTDDAKERQIRANKTRGLKGDLSSARVKFLHADLSKSNFGLSSDDYDELLQETTHIIRKFTRVFKFNH
jgi:hypothetical protein